MFFLSCLEQAPCLSYIHWILAGTRNLIHNTFLPLDRERVETKEGWERVETKEGFRNRIYIYSCKLHSKSTTLSDFVNQLSVKYHLKKMKIHSSTLLLHHCFCAFFSVFSVQFWNNYTFCCSLRESTQSFAWNGLQLREETFMSAKVRRFAHKSDSITIFAF